MEMLVIGLIAIAAFAAVLIPLFRRRPGYGDESEFENIPAAPTEPPGAGSAPGTMPPPPGTASSTSPTPRDSGAHDPPAASGDPVEAEVLRYREAVRAGTVCKKCGQANPADSQFCYECGARLPLADAKEFE
jgi:hypothetical protein